MYVCTALGNPDPITSKVDCLEWTELDLSGWAELTALSIEDWRTILPTIAVLWATAWLMRQLRKQLWH